MFYLSPLISIPTHTPHTPTHPHTHTHTRHTRTHARTHTHTYTHTRHTHTHTHTHTHMYIYTRAHTHTHVKRCRYLDRHWIPRAVEDGVMVDDAPVVPLAEMARQQWTNAIRRKLIADAGRDAQLSTDASKVVTPGAAAAADGDHDDDGRDAQLPTDEPGGGRARDDTASPSGDVPHVKRVRVNDKLDPAAVVKDADVADGDGAACAIAAGDEDGAAQAGVQGAVLRLQTEAANGALTVLTVRCSVVTALFPVLHHIVEDLGIDTRTTTAVPSDVLSDTASDTDNGAVAQLVPLDADACPTDAVRRLIAIGDAVVTASADAVPMALVSARPKKTGGRASGGTAARGRRSGGSTGSAERLYRAHRELVGSTPREVRELIAAANYLGEHRFELCRHRRSHHTSLRACARAHTHTRTHTHTYIHTYIHTHTRAHTHTHTHTYTHHSRTPPHCVPSDSNKQVAPRLSTSGVLHSRHVFHRSTLSKRLSSAPAVRFPQPTTTTMTKMMTRCLSLVSTAAKRESLMRMLLTLAVGMTVVLTAKVSVLLLLLMLMLLLMLLLVLVLLQRVLLRRQR
jgi:hypothetical protein